MIKQKTELSTKATLFVFGIFLTSVVFMLMIKLFKTTGVYLGMLAVAAIIFYGFYYCNEKSYRRIITWGVVVSSTIAILGYLATVIIIKSSLQF